MTPVLPPGSERGQRSSAIAKRVSSIILHSYFLEMALAEIGAVLYCRRTVVTFIFNTSNSYATDSSSSQRSCPLSRQQQEKSIPERWKICANYCLNDACSSRVHEM